MARGGKLYRNTVIGVCQQLAGIRDLPALRKRADWEKGLQICGAGGKWKTMKTSHPLRRQEIKWEIPLHAAKIGAGTRALRKPPYLWRPYLCMLLVGAASVVSALADAQRPVAPDLYELTVTFGDPLGNTQVIKMVVCPDIPFATQIENKDGDRYEVSGTLRKKGQDSFHFDESMISKHNSSSVAGFSSGVPDLVLGRGVGICGIGGIVEIDYSAILTKK